MPERQCSPPCWSAACSASGAPNRAPPTTARTATDHPRRPFDACQSKAAGDSCQVTLRDRTLSGTCAATPAGTSEGTSEGTLACRPDHPPGPPPELSQACAGKADGDACTVTRGDRSDAGVCRKGRSGTLVCLP